MHLKSARSGSAPLDRLGENEEGLQAAMARIAYHARTRRVFEFIESHPRETISLQKAASIACMERTAFSRYFRQRVGPRFRDFVRAVRIHRAIELMEMEDLSIAEIADRTGYGSASTLRRDFRRVTGQPPSVYRTTFAEIATKLPTTAASLQTSGD